MLSLLVIFPFIDKRGWGWGTGLTWRKPSMPGDRDAYI
jgi:hypothetical protein